MSTNKDLAKAAGLLEEAFEILSAIVQERIDAFDEKSERWQEGEKGQEFLERTDEYQSALDELENAKETVSGLVESA